MKYFTIAVLILATTKAVGQRPYSVRSPDGQIKFTIQVTSAAPVYDISYKGKPVILNSPLGLSFQDGGDFRSNLSTGKVISRQGEEKYELQSGRSRFVDDRYNELILPLHNASEQVRIIVRAFNTGIAFRYEFPAHPNRKELLLRDETTTFNLAGNPNALALYLPNYTTSHEGEYTSSTLKLIPDDTLIATPALFEIPGTAYLAITEASLLNYAGMYLEKQNGILGSRLSPLQGKNGLKVKASRPHNSPWRVVMISDRPGSFLESTILTSLSAPSKIKDVSWIKPGKTTFPWWNGNVVPDSINNPGNNFQTNKYYIDFCARNGIEYHSVVEYGGHQWYVDDGTNFQPGPNNDVTKPVPGLDMKAICDYAKSRGVAVRVWVHWGALYPRLDSAFAIFEKWGLAGMMVDFMDRDDQEMVNIQEEMLQKAAKHKLHIQFHGAYKPTGTIRTYPNELTREGTLNYEVNKWDKRITPDHDLNIVFVRMIAGSTDYHMGGFRAVADSLFKVQYTRPLMLGTRCHMLGMYVVLESYLGMLCDYPAAYEGEPGFEFVKTVPTTWDETRVLDAVLHEYIIIARRKGADWYIGSINNHDSRTIEIPLNFLPEGEFNATIYTDAADVNEHPNNLVKRDQKVHAGDRLSLTMAGGGGTAIHISAVGGTR
jgi:alpha-glucosidase